MKKRNHIQKHTKTLLLLLALTIGQFITAQKPVTGTVIDGGINEPLIGATVVVKGTTTGTVTDINGKFSISAKPSDVLVISYIGLEKQELTVGDKTTLNIKLQPASTQLAEVVAIGYGVVKKSDLTGSVAVVSTKELTKNPASSAAQALQGKAAGVLVTQSGKPGGGATIRVRGVGSINKGADPIFILDGVQVGNINSIQPHDIESMQVLKDASATAIYGANGSNGVVIVTTKRGKSGKVQVNLNTYMGVTLAPKKYDIMNASEYSEFYSAIYGSKPEYEQAFREKYYGPGWEKGTDWQDLMFRNGLSQNYNLSIGGGGENSNFNISFGYVNDKGNVIKTDADRYTLRANSDFKLSKYVKFGENLSVAYGSTQDPITWQTSIWDLNASPLMRVYNPYYKGGFESPQTIYWEDTNGNLITGPVAPTGVTTYSNTLNNDKPNPYAVPSMGSNMTYVSSTNASIYMQVDFTDWLMYKVTPSVEINNNRSKNWLPRFTGNRAGGSATLTESYGQGITLNLENQLLFKKNFNNIHNVQATFVHHLRAGQNNSITGAVSGFDFEQLNTLSNGGTTSSKISGYSSDSRMLSYLGRVMYDYKGKYYLTASYRSDGISVFAPAFRRGNFTSGSLAWKINEDFLQNVKELDVLKLRVGWGQTGNSNIGGGFQYLDLISEASAFSPVFGDDQRVVRAQYAFYGFGSKEIHWESAEMWNYGVDINLFNSKLQTSFEYYVKNNNDLLVAIPISSAFGRMDGNPWFNAGKIRNQGVEISIQWRESVGDFNYGVISNFTTIKNEVLSLPVANITSANNRTIVGHSIGALYGYAADGIIQTTDYAGGKDPVSGAYLDYKYATHVGIVPKPGDIRYKDLNGDGDVNALDKTIIGKTIPSFTYTLGFDCSYKNFDFNMFLFGVNDFDIFNQQRASLSSMNSQDMGHNKLVDWAQNYWTESNSSTKHVRLDVSNSNSNDQISSFWIEDGSFLRIKDIQMGYNLPKNTCKTLGLSTLRIYANASNVYCFTGYTGRDPESYISGNPISSGTDAGGYSIPKSFTAGLQIGF